MKQVNNTIPVYDICSLGGTDHLHDDIIADKLAHYLAEHNNLCFPHRHSFYHIVLFTQGGGDHTIDFMKFPVGRGYMYFMVPGQVHTWNFTNDVDGFIINCSDGFIHAFLPQEEMGAKVPVFSGLASDGVVKLPEDVFQIACGLMQQIIDEIRNADHFSKTMVSVKLLELLIAVSRSAGSPAANGIVQQNYLVLYNFRKLVGMHFASMHLPKEYAALLYITPNHLNAVCKELLGKPAGELIRERVLLEAKRLLVNGGVNISEIGWQLGFSDNSYFTKFFRKYEAVTPEEFRKSFLYHSTNSHVRSK